MPNNQPTDTLPPDSSLKKNIAKWMRSMISTILLVGCLSGIILANQFDTSSWMISSLSRGSAPTSQDVATAEENAAIDAPVFISSYNQRNKTEGSKNDVLIACDCDKWVPCRVNPCPCHNKENVTISTFWQRDYCAHSLRSNVAFFHAGKGGGGTLESMMEHNRVGVTVSHPGPEKRVISQLQEGPMDTLLLTVRDPVDRLVSAFQWRLLISCHPNDARMKVGMPELRRGIRAAKNPGIYCKEANREEVMLREKYDSNPNLLAEAICLESPGYEEAVKDLQKIGHSTTLAQWVNFLIDPILKNRIKLEGIKKFVVVPLAEQFANGTRTFEQQIDHLILELLANKYGEHVANNILGQKPPDMTRTKEEEKISQHSSAIYNNQTSESKSAMLSPLGECCLARYFMKDYQLIQTMLVDNDSNDYSNIENDTMDDGSGSLKRSVVEPLINVHPLIHTACSWGSEAQQTLCRTDLLSILTRRAMYLVDTFESCQEIVSKIVE